MTIITLVYFVILVACEIFPFPGVTTRIQVGTRVYSGCIQARQPHSGVTHDHHNLVDAFKHVTRSGVTHDHHKLGPTQKDDAIANLRPRKECELNDALRTDIYEQEQDQGTESDFENFEKETQGPTCMENIWGRPPHLPRLHVEYNDKGVPIDGECSKPSHFLGSIARNCQYCPISMKDWREIEIKDEILNIVKLRFHVPPIEEKKILSSVGQKWRAWKNRLKAKYWYEASVESLKNERDLELLKLKG
ncbi:OLC1v1016305C1 [Oldenlandia corymbosa var. corymbosa]|uniref:OLC1v1016305C1 n=1 Tax=Oldenlandia corymbosa var. corymbosa TaxID=529605 RepID=A0AAV1E5E3_OLDCO|nr:OLC1v1016305C1 [Oldenlandia corymbosa var. corymbosa]